MPTERGTLVKMNGNEAFILEKLQPHRCPGVWCRASVGFEESESPLHN